MPKKEGVFPKHPRSTHCPFTERNPRRMDWAPVAVRHHYDKKAELCGRPRCVDRGRTMKLFAMNFFMANVREMVNTHLPVALKLINSAALVAIALSTLCAAGSLREMSGRSAAPAAVTEAN